MTPRHPDLNTLNATIASYAASSPLAHRIAAVTPVGGHVATGLTAKLDDILAQAGSAGDPLTGPLIIAVDTLFVPAREVVVVAPAVAIVARSVVVHSGGPATTIVVRHDGQEAGISLAVQSITGRIAARFETAAGKPVGEPAPLALRGTRTPQVITALSDKPVDATSNPAALADILHSPWSILALEFSSVAAGILIDRNDDEARGLAGDMLSWVVGGCYALLREQASYSTVDFHNVASLQNTSIALLAFTQASTSGATYVPVLSTGIYQAEIDGLLAVAKTYDEKLAQLQAQEDVDRLLGAFASTLESINRSAETPLYNTLVRLDQESGSVERQLENAAVQLQQVAETIRPLQRALQEAIERQFQDELIKAAFETFFNVLNLYAGAAAAVFGDLEALDGPAAKQLAVAIEATKGLIEGGETTVRAAIESSRGAAGGPLSTNSVQSAEAGARYLMGSVAGFGEAVNALWTVVNRAIAGGKGRIDFSPGVLQAVEKLPDLSGLSVAGLDPVTYWQTIVVQTETAVQPHADLPEAAPYLEAVRLAATYGRAVGDLQMKLLDLYTQGIAAFDRLKAISDAEAQWQDLSSLIDREDAKIAAAIGLLQRDYLATKRNLVVAVDNFRAAFRYQWLREPDVRIDVTMDFVSLEREATRSIADLQNVLVGAPSGPIKPRQTFNDVVYEVKRGAGPLFTEVDGKGQAQWSIPLSETTFSDRLSGNTALFLTAVLFELIGAEQTGEVQLDIATSGHYDNKFDDQSFRFVSRPVSMINNYTPGSPPHFIAPWRFSDAAAYLAPTPYTNWTLRVRRGNWRDVTAIRMTLACGTFLQNQRAVATSQAA